MTDKTKTLEKEILDLKAKYMGLLSQLSVLTMFSKALIHAMNTEQRTFLEAELKRGLEGFLALADQQPQFAAHHSDALATANALLAEFERLRPAAS
ncbi:MULTISPECIES: hypothetical protein [Burkholderia cepacia complex]|uniref:hypothetical protein n=1 Tax=Burkholderia cepacia complex TaxID=87882 RepID=UPI000F0919C6|nr:MULTISPECIES: hypothetical protein [Burkholderia cepacia complex]AYQ38313.1 hypothetical protein CVS37_09510 [Burkholderia lata]